MAARLTRLWPAVFRPHMSALCGPRFVSQTPQSGAAGGAALPDLQAAHAAESHGHAEVNPFEKNPDYHGFSTDAHADDWNMKLAFFFGISVAIVIGGTFIHYLPDHGMRQWARREAERLIKQREAEGLLLMDENYYDPSKIVLPAKEE
ncbi:NADH dehydrogenase [ubiquinone] 1 beta subcomplex subunit 11, mitochondrial [Denticeps clupeoides]|uniref:NADH dehydrogenase [ubiquinone] 1 beta subcomplex subunit 11, mitochondrial n=1 Tax=Denticeps clupeoides TaxID=299321 RepID=A0AAY4DTN2_9TELE|nr:NADH dehydrogenase [ubiquinone] 1 beta subcomplex subunit 11, mitochondrial [Denticeps clupeoides]